jgi:hypothetical protein
MVNEITGEFLPITLAVSTQGQSVSLAEDLVRRPGIRPPVRRTAAGLHVSLRISTMLARAVTNCSNATVVPGPGFGSTRACLTGTPPDTTGVLGGPSVPGATVASWPLAAVVAVEPACIG